MINEELKNFYKERLIEDLQNINEGGDGTKLGVAAAAMLGAAGLLGFRAGDHLAASRATPTKTGPYGYLANTEWAKKHHPDSGGNPEVAKKMWTADAEKILQTKHDPSNKEAEENLDRVIAAGFARPGSDTVVDARSSSTPVEFPSWRQGLMGGEQIYQHPYHVSSDNPPRFKPTETQPTYMFDPEHRLAAIKNIAGSAGLGAAGLATGLAALGAAGEGSRGSRGSRRRK